LQSQNATYLRKAGKNQRRIYTGKYHGKFFENNLCKIGQAQSSASFAICIALCERFNANKVQNLLQLQTNQKPFKNI
jgi:hypothetical protein